MNKLGVILMALTVLLVIIGCVLYTIGYVGWAQLFWVFSSGTAGGAIVFFIEGRTE